MEHERFEFKHVANIVDMAPSSSKMLQIGRRMDRTGYYPKTKTEKHISPNKSRPHGIWSCKEGVLPVRWCFPLTDVFSLFPKSRLTRPQLPHYGNKCLCGEEEAGFGNGCLMEETIPLGAAVRLCPPPCVSSFKVLRTEVFMSVFLVRLNLKSSNVDHFI